MPSIIDRMKSQVQSTEAPPVTQVFNAQEAPKETTIVQSIIEPKVIKQNDPGTPLHGFTLQTLANELGVVLEKAMHKAGVNSVNTDVFGIFGSMGLTPKGFKLVQDPYTDKSFYVLKSSNRMTEVFKALVKALNASSAEVISFPYLVETVVTLPIKYIASSEEFEYDTIKIESLYLTPKEISELNYKFIKEIQFCEGNKEVAGSIDLIAMRIDRAEWKAAPYRI